MTYDIPIGKISASLEQAFTFILAAIISYDVSTFVRLPTSNPYSISNHYLSTGFNPEDNYARVIAVILLTIAFFYLFKPLFRRSYKLQVVILALFLSFSYLLGTAVPVYNAPQSIDPFQH